MNPRLALGLFFLGNVSAFGQLEQLNGLNGLQDVELSALSQQDDNRLGAAALALHPEDWKHAEGEHFIYHYVRSFVASRAAVEAEFNYRVVIKELDKTSPPTTANATSTSSIGRKTGRNSRRSGSSRNGPVAFNR